MPLELTRRSTAHGVRIELRGDLVHLHTEGLVTTVSELLTQQGRPAELVLDCSGVTAVDSSGLSSLLMIRRMTNAARVPLHLTQRPLRLERMLEVTGTRAYLTAPEEARTASRQSDRTSAASEESIPARKSPPDSSS
ncbi:STAS domain-containing protein [Streptomyces sp. NPDC048507]|uniref:STAS domain-containing protein n=1 Tax=Streptomyces sp. NPDC048507 TaxID=3365560 RepID=UPI00371B560E